MTHNQDCPYLIGVFEDRFEAEQTVDELEQAGFGRGDIGFVIRGSDAVAGGMITDAVGTKDSKGVVTGLIAGGVTGGILAAAASLLIPGVGPVLAGGILATALGGVAAGAATGGILGALAGLGVSEEEARFYEQEFHSGKAIVTVRPGPRPAEAMRILENHRAYDFHCRDQGLPDPQAVAAANDSRNSSSGERAR